MLWWATRRAVIDGAASIKAAKTSAEALTRAETAYLSGGGVAFKGTIEDQGKEAIEHARLGRPNIFTIEVSNYGKTPADLIEIHIGFLDVYDRPIPKIVPPIRSGDVYYFRQWIKPYTERHHIRHIYIPEHLHRPVIFGRLYYRDVIFKKRISTGFILEIVLQTSEARAIRAPEAYTEERDESADQSPRISGG